VRLVACSNCHTQYDVTSVVDREIACRCGTKIENRTFDGIEVQVHRCGSCGAQVGADAAACAYCGSEIVRDDANLSLICPECFGRNRETSHFCTGCGVPFRPEPVEVAGEELPCPNCGCLMAVRAIGGIGINECPQCNGLWVPENRFDHLIAQACEAARSRVGAAPSTPKSAGGIAKKVVYRSCPVCDAHMARKNFRKRSGVIIDRCSTHGTWLDADELEQIAGFILSGRGSAESDAAKRAAAETFARVASTSKTPKLYFAEGDRREGLMGSMVDVLIDLLK